ncbi:MAG: hypothetical protein Q8Q42_04370 [Nanoarchaeota archaeon]|nr:hypothetical protein [Nanoarchaeota archaeon]
MKSLKKGAFIVFFLLFTLSMTPQTEAQEATVHGIVYNIFLEELDKAIITVNTEPEQIIISQNGEYSFKVRPGNYIVTVTYNEENNMYELTENLKITEPGDYRIDLILIPELDDQNNEGEEFNVYEEPKKDKPVKTFIAAIIAMIIIILYFYSSKKHFIKDKELKSELENEIDKVIKFIKQHNGMVTQKEIRKNFPSSEAKISLMITELESKGIVKRIKRGRGNIIILKK